VERFYYLFHHLSILVINTIFLTFFSTCIYEYVNVLLIEDVGKYNVAMSNKLSFMHWSIRNQEKAFIHHSWSHLT